ncbi:23S rRNA (adenine(2503)-C(2))-methyltransferase RlmN [Chlamydiota bacterium]
MKTVSIFSLTSEEYAEAVRSRLGKGAQHARLLYREWFRTGRVTGQDPHFRNAGPLFEQIVAMTDFTYLSLVKRGDEHSTEKYLIQTGDGLEVEMVVLPMQAGYTLCISSQVGCRMGCAFCETGKMGLLRSLSTAEILSQVFQARHGLGLNVRNIVFMGMGEPLDNYEAVMQAVKILTDSNGFGLGPSRITLSTSGLVDKIYRLIEEADPALCLAVSVNAPHDGVRNKLMPVNKRFDMADLKQAMEAYTLHPRRRILIEYILIKGKTDSLEDADALALYLKGLRVTVNLIPYNPQSRGPFEPPTADSVDAFLKRMKERGFLTFVRSTKGQKIMAACGQLGNLELRRKKSLVFSQE